MKIKMFDHRHKGLLRDFPLLTKGDSGDGSSFDQGEYSGEDQVYPNILDLYNKAVEPTEIEVLRLR